MHARMLHGTRGRGPGPTRRFGWRPVWRRKRSGRSESRLRAGLPQSQRLQLRHAADLLAHTPEIVLVHDLGGAIRGVNRAAENTLGYLARALVGRSGACLVAAHQAVEWRSWRRRLAAGQALGPLRMQLRGTRAAPIDVEASLAPLRDGHRRAIGFVLLARAITRPDELERRRNRFLFVLAHEMRTPLCSVVGLADLLTGPEEVDGAERREFARDILAAGERLNRLLDDLVKMARCTDEDLEVRARSVRLEPCIDQAVQQARAQFETPVHVAIPSPLPEVWGDPDRLVQVLVNLLLNALRYSPPEGAVVVSAVVENGLVRMSVRDEGPGIPPEKRERIFAPFEQGDRPAAAHHSGFGLGLYVCRRIVEGHGGTIEVDSPSEGGCVFRFTIPRATA